MSKFAVYEPVVFDLAGDSSVSLWISPGAIGSMIESAKSAGRFETGGILVGRYGSEGWFADIVEATPKPKGSKSGWSWFQRSDHGLQALLEERWNQGFHYLGEWHTHPAADTKPSASDFRAMGAIATDEIYRCPSPILVILGGSSSTNWKLSATLFREGSKLELTQSADGLATSD